MACLLLIIIAAQCVFSQLQPLLPVLQLDELPLQLNILLSWSNPEIPPPHNAFTSLLSKLNSFLQLGESKMAVCLYMGLARHPSIEDFCSCSVCSAVTSEHRHHFLFSSWPLQTE